MAFALALATPRASAATIVVDSAADTAVAGDGACTLREAIVNANNDSDATNGDCAAGSGADAITFAQNYTITLAGSQLPTITGDITITGNGEANTIVQASTCNPVTLPGGCTPASWRVLQIDAAGTLTLQDATVRYGDKLCFVPNCNGGGIYNSGMLLLTDVALSDNDAYNGGGLYTGPGSTAALQSVTVAGNAGRYGAGIEQDSYGGATTTSLTRVVFSGNTADKDGGGFSQFAGGEAVLTDVSFDTNVARNGGGLYSHGTLVLNRATFKDNAANGASGIGTGGGGMYTGERNTLSNVTFSGNTTTSYGGGLFINVGAPTTLTNVSFSGNAAPDGQGGGLFTAFPAKLANVIIANSSGGDCYAYNDGGLDASSSNNLIEDSAYACGLTDGDANANIVGHDPLLGPLADNGGFTQTMALQYGSPAIDAGDNGALSEAVSGVDYNGDGDTDDTIDTDQRGSGYPRIVSGTVDMGAYEFVDDTSPTLLSFTRQNPATSPTNADTLVFRATFSEAVQNVDVGDFTVDSTGTATIASVSSVDATTYDITVSGGDLAGFNGTVGLDLAAGQNITDIYGTPLSASEPATDETYTLDNTAPTVTISSTAGDPTATSPIPVSITFSEPVDDFALGDISVGNGMAGNFAGSGDTYTVDITPGADGTVTIDIGADVATDAAGNGNTAATQFSIDSDAHQQTGPAFVVNTDADTDDSACDPTGQGIGNQDCTLREAINAANAYSAANSGAATTITFAADYTITLDGNRLPTITGDIAITGNGEANTIVQASTCNPVTLPGGCTPASWRVLQIDAAGTLTLQDATVRYGNNKPSGVYCTVLKCYGGGIVNKGVLVLIRVALSDNNARLGGGGLANDTGSTATLQSVTITGNAAATLGGGIYNAGGVLTMTDSAVSGNSAYSGGGISLHGNGPATAITASLTRVVFSGNTADTDGGGLWQIGGDPTRYQTMLTDVSFDANIAGTSGGGLYSVGSVTLTLNRATFKDNAANGSSDLDNGGGGMLVGAGMITLVNTTFSGNTTTSYGGGLYTNASTTPTTLTDVSFSGNQAPDGHGGGLFTVLPAKLANVIIANSSGGDCYAYNDGGLDASSSNNLIEDSAYACGLTDGDANGNIVGHDPLLAPLADNGGLTETLLPNPDSPAIDAGTCTDVDDNVIPAADQRAITRPQGAGCDIGAVEVEQAQLSLTVSGNGAVGTTSDSSLISANIDACRNATCTASYDIEGGAPSITLTAAPDTGYHLVGWTGDCSTAGTNLTASVTMDAERSCGVTFAVDTHTIGGTISGLSGSGLMLQDNDGDDLSISDNGSFTFATPLDYGATYAATVSTQPSAPTQTCTVSNGSDTVGDGDVTNVSVNCTTNTYTVGGSVSGLTGSGLVLQLNGQNMPIGSDGSFTFATPLYSGSYYSVTVNTQPDGQTCSVGNATGMVTNADISDVTVACTDTAPNVSLGVGDGQDYANYGQVLDYSVTLSNSGNSAQDGVSVGGLLSAALDANSVRWICAAAGGATCNNGSGDFSDTVDLPANSSVTYDVTVTVLADSSESTARFGVSATGVTPVSDTDTLVIFRDGFEGPQTVPSAQSIRVGSDVAEAVLQGDQTEFVDVPAATQKGIDTLQTLRSGNEELRVQRLSLNEQLYVRLLTRDASRLEHASTWSATQSGAELGIASADGADGQRIVLMEGAAQPLSLPLPAP